MDVPLPSGDSPSLILIHPTDQEQYEQTLENSKMWRGPLQLDPYLRREQRLANVQLTKDGGITFWVLVDSKESVPAGSSRKVLAGCESLAKRALVVEDGILKDATCHGVASVFSPERYRGRGYGARMMEELGNHLKGWKRVEGKPQLSVLYSDIGKRFYAKQDWRPYTSSHMHLPPLPSTATTSVRTPESSPLTASALPSLCALDEELLRKRLITIAANSASKRPIVALIPDAATMAWHYAREDFVAQELFGKVPAVKGAQVLIPDPSSPSGKRRAWGIWTRTWNSADTSTAKGNTLHLLRVCVEPTKPDLELDGVFVENTQAIMAILHQAQLQAAEWGMAEVEVWNPGSATRQAVKLLAQDSVLIDRASESICCLKWYGDYDDASETEEIVDWIENEKFGWC